MKVLKLKDQAAFEKLVIQRGNSIILPVNDGEGNLIISVESLTDPAFADVSNELAELTEEIEYVPFPATIEAVEQKIQQLDAAKLLLKYDPATGEAKRGTKTVYTKTGEIDIESDGIIDTVVSWTKGAVNWVMNLFK